MLGGRPEDLITEAPRPQKVGASTPVPQEGDAAFSSKLAMLLGLDDEDLFAQIRRESSAVLRGFPPLGIADPDDIAMDVWLKLRNAADSLPGNLSGGVKILNTKAFIKKSVKNRYLDIAKRERRLVPLEDFTEKADTLTNGSDAKIEVGQLPRFIELLYSKNHSEYFLLSLDGHSQAEIAQQMGLSAPTISGYKRDIRRINSKISEFIKRIFDNDRDDDPDGGGNGTGMKPKKSERKNSANALATLLRSERNGSDSGCGSLLARRIRISQVNEFFRLAMHLPAFCEPGETPKIKDLREILERLNSQHSNEELGLSRSGKDKSEEFCPQSESLNGRENTTERVVAERERFTAADWVGDGGWSRIVPRALLPFELLRADMTAPELLRALAERERFTTVNWVGGCRALGDWSGEPFHVGMIATEFLYALNEREGFTTAAAWVGDDWWSRIVRLALDPPGERWRTALAAPLRVGILAFDEQERFTTVNWVGGCRALGDWSGEPFQVGMIATEFLYALNEREGFTTSAWSWSRIGHRARLPFGELRFSISAFDERSGELLQAGMIEPLQSRIVFLAPLPSRELVRLGNRARLLDAERAAIKKNFQKRLFGEELGRRIEDGCTAAVKLPTLRRWAATVGIDDDRIAAMKLRALRKLCALLAEAIVARIEARVPRLDRWPFDDRLGVIVEKSNRGLLDLDDENGDAGGQGGEDLVN